MRGGAVAAPGRPRPEGMIRTFEEHLGAWGTLFTNSLYYEEEETESLAWRSLETIIRVTGAAGCSVTLLDRSQELLVRGRPTAPDRVTYNRDTMIKPGCLGHDAIRSGTPQIVNSVQNDPLHYYPAAVTENDFKSAACFPLGARGKVVGVLSLYFSENRSLTPPERDLGMALAQSTALAVDNAMLLEESRMNYLNTVQALVRSLEARDSSTSFHSLRVTQYATVLGEKLDLNCQDMRALQFGSMLHDIGKIGISNEILQKKGKLSSDEFQVMREHPLIGARIVETVDFLQDAIPAITHHHEMYDGKGYPDGLKGRDIPLIARILTVPDFFDALTTERPYRDALPAETVLARIREGSGKLFDPDIASFFLDIHQCGGIPAPS